MTELNSLSKFKRCVIKKSVSNFKIIILALLFAIVGFVLLVTCAYIIKLFGLESYVITIVVMDILTIMLLTCLISIKKKYKDDPINLLKRFLLLHIIVPIELCIFGIVYICAFGIPFLAYMGVGIVAILYGVEFDMVTIMAFASCIISFAINIAFCECLHVDKWCITNMRNVFNWIDLDESEWL